MMACVSKEEAIFSQYLYSFQLIEKTSPGSGRHLFVQACVLAGCDYTVNSTQALEGIGLITVFKLIAAHSNQSHIKRFAHVLKDWNRRKTKGGSVSMADLTKYEDLLPEAVFYYHYVLCEKNKIVVPLQPQQLDDIVIPRLTLVTGIPGSQRQ